MDSVEWNTAFAASSDPRRAAHHFRLLRDGLTAGDLDHLSPESVRVTAEVLAGSRWLSALLGQHPQWLSLLAAPEGLKRPLRRESLRREIDTFLVPALERDDVQNALNGIHELRLRELLRIGVRDLARLGSLPDILTELSNVADLFLDGILRIVWKPQVERFGEPWHRDADQRWQRTAFAVLGMGKLGGQELNYSSDVDLMFLYSEEGGTFRTPPRPKQTTAAILPNHQFFKRVGEALIREATARGVDGGALRIDMRLRPEGKAGPLARSLASYENFYAEWGQSWERMMLLKARGVAGDESLAGEFLEVIQPFRYPRSIGEGLLREMSEMKARIEREVVRAGELDRNVKLGRGGIREIEFAVQALQVLHGGRNPFLQGNQTLAALEKLSGYTLLPASDATALAAAYRFLRDVEHRLQMDEHQQTHTLPEEDSALERLARQMAMTSRTQFARALTEHTHRVRVVYDMVLGKTAPPSAAESIPAGFDEPDGKAWHGLLANRGFRDPEKGLRLLRVLIEGPGFGHVSRRTTALGRQLAERLLDLCPASDPRKDAEPDGFMLSDPDRVVARLDSYIANYGARASLYELWTSRPNVFAHILKLFDRSEFLAELAIREPDLVDQLEAGAHLGRQKDACQTLADLRHGLKDPDQHLWLRRYFQTEFMRLGLRDILGYVEFEQANAELSALAEACVQYAIEVVTRRHRLRHPPFAIIGLGKFGGRELVYGSDLDIVFVAPNRTRDLPPLQKMAGEIMDLLSTRTPQGSVFILDPRLRPDGEKGLLANLLRSYEDYYRQRAMLWEIQALTRARWVAGHAATGKAFEELARHLSDFQNPSRPLAAFQPDWKRQITEMRLRIERERTPKGMEALAFKTGAGGLIDAEFLAQTFAMEHGWFEPNTLKSLERARDLRILDQPDAARLIENFRQLRRMESILRRWSFEGEVVLPDEPAAQYRVAVRCGYRDVPAFLADVARWREEIRSVYSSFLGQLADEIPTKVSKR
jgi:glutamate-ammonia-ligase adenylyltransferase